MEKSNISEILKYWIIAACIYTVLAGMILFIDVSEVERMGYLHDSNILDVMVTKYYIVICYIVIPISVIVSMLIRKKVMYAFSLMCEELMIIYDYVRLSKSKTYSKFKVFYLIVCVVAIVACVLWSFKKINNAWMLGILLLAQLEGLEWIVKNVKNTKSAIFVILLFIALLVMNTMPIYIIKTNKAKINTITEK